MRFGKEGKIAVTVSGNEAGSWYDFGRSEGGDMFSLVQREKGYNFKEAADYLRSFVGGYDTGKFKWESLSIAEQNELIDRIDKHQREQEKAAKAEKVKAEYASKTYSKSKELLDSSIASRYLREKRGINIKAGGDIRTKTIYEKEKGGYLPALISFARNKQGAVSLYTSPSPRDATLSRMPSSA